ncbi:MAG: hypothetical protein M9936_02630 [Caldilinea sp.]|nr:hypothetical protein [Caldilinea sp.]MCB0058394.1 hypothetical protein [Caldilineaceae bacterium]MCB9140654.1 hypothetical protein [Anaerolineales bacterium]MCB0049029.1 hypothetical protein [Caldilinea sp.]MCB0148630.1 hypothetical protein [Caldilineaceae bacterium]
MTNSAFRTENDQPSGSRAFVRGVTVEGSDFESPDHFFKVVRRDLGRQLPFIVTIGERFDLDFEFMNTSSTQVCELRVEVGCLPAAEVDIVSFNDDFVVSSVPKQDFVNRRVNDMAIAVISTKLNKEPLQNRETIRGQIGVRIRRIVGAVKPAGEIREIPGRLGLYQINMKLEIWRVNESTKHTGGSVITERAVIFQPLPLVSRLRHVTKEEISVFLAAVMIAYILGVLMPNPKESLDAVIRWFYTFPTDTFLRW